MLNNQDNTDAHRHADANITLKLGIELVGWRAADEQLDITGRLRSSIRLPTLSAAREEDAHEDEEEDEDNATKRTGITRALAQPSRLLRRALEKASERLGEGLTTLITRAALGGEEDNTIEVEP